MKADAILDAWVNEAECEFREKGWKQASQNAVLLTMFARLERSFTDRFQQVLMPLWIMASSVATAVIWLIIRQAILGLGS